MRTAGHGERNMKKYHLIVNAARAGGRKIEKIAECFAKAGKELIVCNTKYKGHCTEIVKDLTKEGECVIVVMGGDGMLHEAINGIQDFEKCALGLIPCGTGNDFAAAAGIPKNLKRAADIITDGTPKNIDYIQLSNGLKSINATGMGIDVEVLKRAYLKKGGGKGKYLSALIYCLKHFKSYNFKVNFDGTEQQHYGLIAALGNGKQLGGGIKLFPEAKLDDGYMDLIMVDYISRASTVFAFIKLMLGKIKSVKQATYVRVKHAAFTTAAPCPIQAEGEIYEGITLDASVVAGGLKFYLPQRG